MIAFAVYDRKAASYGMPIFAVAVGSAARSFEDACMDSRSPMCAHPEDFSLSEIGTYEPISGKLSPHPEPKFVISASECVAKHAKARLAVEPMLPAMAEVSR